MNESMNWTSYNDTDFMYPRRDWDPFENWGTTDFALYYLWAIGYPIAILISTCLNVIGLVTTTRGRMWDRHEGYLYVTAIFATNIAILFFNSGTFWYQTTFPHHYYGESSPRNSSEFFCKVWHFFMTVFFASGWQSVALLFDVYLREHMTHRRRCGCPIFASKYCTLRATKIVLAVIFITLFILALPSLGIMTTQRFHGECYPASFLAFNIVTMIRWLLMWVLPFVFFLPVILILNLCISTEGDRFGFAQIEDRSVSNDRFRTVAASVSAMIFFSQVSIGITSRFRWRWFRGGRSDVIYYVMQAVYDLGAGMPTVLCLIMLPDFRKQFLSWIQRILCCRQSSTEQQQVPDIDHVRLTEVDENEVQAGTDE